MFELHVAAQWIYIDVRSTFESADVSFVPKAEIARLAKLPFAANAQNGQAVVRYAK